MDYMSSFNQNLIKSVNSGDLFLKTEEDRILNGWAYIGEQSEKKVLNELNLKKSTPLGIFTPVMYYVALLVISCASHVIASPLNKSLTLGNDTSLEDDEDKTYPPGIKFLGGGYNLITGNPNNRRSDNGGADPGLLPSSRILRFTEGNKKTIQRGFDLYDEISYTPRNACVKEKSNSIVKDTQSYQDELTVGVSLGAE
ncbi:hypothetical protein AC249_AIPGENE24876 [Exaiptasia diaphana]|nr:hypothetical protein AC249_AIPGENE24876 [Exaiptasia diaphana]